MAKHKNGTPGEVYDYEKRFSSDVQSVAIGISKNLDEFRETGTYPERIHRQELTAADRLAYYRSHGLSDCSDYPGGDAQFASDVLSGAQRDEDSAAMGPLGNEDAYVISMMEDGKFAYDADFVRFPCRPEVLLAYYENGARCHVHLPPHIYPGGLPRFRLDVGSGEYAKRKLRARGML